jgi:hypothetical protein
MAEVTFAIVPHDTNEIAFYTKAIYVGSGGNVTLRSSKSTADVTYLNVPTGCYLTVCASHVRATGTTATGLISEA